MNFVVNLLKVLQPCWEMSKISCTENLVMTDSFGWFVLLEFASNGLLNQEMQASPL